MEAYNAVRPLSQNEKLALPSLMRTNALLVAWYRWRNFHIDVADAPVDAKESFREMLRVHRTIEDTPILEAGATKTVAEPVEQPKTEDGSKEEPQVGTMQLAKLPAIPDFHKPEWNVNFGPLHVGSDGFGFRPQMAFGITVGNFDVEIGLNDIRNGIEIMAFAQVAVAFDSEGHNIRELHDNIKCDTPGFQEVLAKVKDLLGGAEEHVGNAVQAAG
jgi:hypothetical protein